MNTRQDDNISIYNIRRISMEKKDKIKARIIEHKEELRRLYGLPQTIEKSSKMIDTQIFNVKKAIQNLTVRFLKVGGRMEELEHLEPKIEKKETAPLIIREEKKIKRGRKSKR